MRSMSSTRSSPPDPQRPADAGNLDGAGGSADPADCSMLLGMDAAAAAGTDIHTSSSNVNTSSSNSNDNNNPSSSSVGGVGAGAGSDMSSSSNSGGTTIASGGATSYGSPSGPASAAGCGGHQGAAGSGSGPAYTNAGAGSVDSGGSMIRTDSHHSLLAMGFPSVSGSTPGPGPQHQQELSDSSPGTSSRGSESACVPSHHQHHCGCDACGSDDPDSLLLAMDVASCSAGVPESTMPGGTGGGHGGSDWNGFWMPSVVGGEQCHLDVEPPQDDDDEEQRVMHHLMSGGAPTSTGFLHNMDHHGHHHMQHSHGHHHHHQSMALGGMFGGGGRRGISDDIDMVHMAHIPEVDHFCESLLNVEDHHQQHHNVMGVRGSMGMVSNLDSTSCYNMGNHGSGSAMWSPMQQHMEAPAPAPSWMDAPLPAHSRHSTTQLSSSLVHHRDSPSVVVTSSSSAGHGHGSWSYSPAPGPPPPSSSYTMDALSMPFHHHHHSPAPAPQRGPVVTADMSSSPPAGLHTHLHHQQQHQQQHMLTRRHSSSWTPSGSDFTFFNNTTGTPSSSPPTMPLSSSPSPSPSHLVRSLSTSVLGSDHHLFLDTSCSTGTASGVSLVGPPGRRHSPGIKRSLSFMHSTMSPPGNCDDDGALALDPVAGSPRRGSPSKVYRGDTGNGPATSSVAMAMAGVSSPPDTSAAAAAAGGNSQLALQELKLAMGLGTGATNSTTSNNNATMANAAAATTSSATAASSTTTSTTTSSGGAPPFRPGIDDAAAQLSALLYTKSRTDIGNNAISQYHKLAFQNSFYSAAAAAQAAAGAGTGGGTKTDGGLTSGVLGTSSTSTTKTAARRRHGTATDPQSIAARTRRERFSDRIRILQSLVPNGERLDTVSMLGQTLEYVRFLQQQVWQLYNGAPGPLSAAGGMHGGMHTGMQSAAAAAATNLNLAAQVASAESLAASFLSSMAQRQAAAVAASSGGGGEVQNLMMSGGAGGPMPTKAGHGGGGPPGPLDKWKMAGNGGSPQCTPVA